MTPAWQVMAERGLTAPFWALDVCSGIGGVTVGMQAAGFRTLGIDIKAHRGYPGPQLLQDVRLLGDADLRWHLLGGQQWGWTHYSPPCQRFSKARTTRVKDPPTDADTDILRACMDLNDDLGAPFWSVENVSGAVKFFEPYIGKPRYVDGPFYFWGNFPKFVPEATGLKKHMSTWGLDPETGLRDWGVKNGKSGASKRAITPLEIVRPLAKAIMAELRPELTVTNPSVLDFAPVGKVVKND